jgi:hypothetical protein
MVTFTTKIEPKTLKFKPENVNPRPEHKNSNLQTLTLTPKPKTNHKPQKSDLKTLKFEL